MKFEPIDSAVIMCCLFISVLWIPTIIRGISFIKEKGNSLSPSYFKKVFAIWIIILLIAIIFTIIPKTISVSIILAAVYPTIDLCLSFYTFKKIKQANHENKSID